MKAKSVKRAEAIVRNTAWAAMDPVHQLVHLDTFGLVAKKQRAKIAEKMKK